MSLLSPCALAWPWGRGEKQLGHGRQATTNLNTPTPRITLPNFVNPVKGRADGVWLPCPPAVERPYAKYNATSLAYLGDCVYELYVRNHFLIPPKSIDHYNNLVTGLVCCEAQDALLKQLLRDEFLSEEERDIVRWGRNADFGKRKATRRAGTAVYCSASSLETLIGYVYLTNSARLEQIMSRLGLCCRYNVEEEREEKS